MKKILFSDRYYWRLEHLDVGLHQPSEEMDMPTEISIIKERGKGEIFDNLSSLHTRILRKHNINTIGTPWKREDQPFLRQVTPRSRRIQRSIYTGIRTTWNLETTHPICHFEICSAFKPTMVIIQTIHYLIMYLQCWLINDDW